MNTSTDRLQSPRAQQLTFDDESMIVDFVDGRTLIIPLEWYPRLLHGTPKERSNWRFIGKGEGIHWPELDEDIRIENLLAGKPSGESQSSLRRWLRQRGEK